MVEESIHIKSEEIANAQVKEDPSVLAKIEVKQGPVALVSVADGLTKAPTTTSEEDLHSKSQRKINLIWETTQGVVAVIVTLTACAISVILIFRNEHSSSLQLISSMVFMILGFYYGRSNHTNVGGVKLGTRDTR